MKRSKKAKKCNFKLNEIEGRKFRVMWSTKFLYVVTYLEIIIAAFIAVSYALGNVEISMDWGQLLVMEGAFVIFMLVLSVINDKFLGRLVAVINEEGIYTKSKFIPWKDIKEVCYRLSIPKKPRGGEADYSRLEVMCRRRENGCVIVHAPHKMLRYVKKNVPGLKVTRDDEFIREAILQIFIVSVLSIIFKFVI